MAAGEDIHGLDDVAFENVADTDDLAHWTGPEVPMQKCTTRSTLAAKVGTMNVADAFPPASNGKVQILINASRAELACSVHIPGSPGSVWHFSLREPLSCSWT